MDLKKDYLYYLISLDSVIKHPKLYRKVVMDKEGEDFYYSINKKLLVKSDRRLSNSEVSYFLEQYLESSPNLYEDYESVQKSRDRKLNKII